MLNDQLEERVKKEREKHNEGLRRERYDGILSHATFFYHEFFYRIITDVMKEYAENKVGLELGDTCWHSWIEKPGIYPKKLTCINISERELEKGIKLSKNSIMKPEFRLMDAHRLEFEDNSLDFVFGGGILHHLDLEISLNEISRVLKPGGMMLFTEPLNINPVSKIIRILTPEARTEDERPFGFGELKLLEERFITSISYGQFISVPLGVLSKFLFKTPANMLMKIAFLIDTNLIKFFPPLKYLYRTILITGKPKK